MEELLRITVTDNVYNILKDKILNLDYKPGRALSAVKITKEMNVSRSPAREALIKLQSDNLVEIIPQVGTKVSLINLDKLNEERFLRTSLENAALTTFTYNHSTDQINNM
ncbi:MAG: GntR family transcriptional regulator [Sphaerochaetaceae bacterium]|nr:GntR family transcriptional regulator [Sphaerochaetaceae bacterium]